MAKTSGVAIELRLHPFLLDPSTPPEGRDLRSYLAQSDAFVEVLGRLADQVGWNAAEARDAAIDRNRRDEVAAAARQASTRGISGVPYVVIAGRALSGAQPVATFAQALTTAAAKAN